MYLTVLPTSNRWWAILNMYLRLPARACIVLLTGRERPSREIKEITMSHLSADQPVTRTTEVRSTSPIYFTGPVSVFGPGRPSRGKAPRADLDRVFRGRLKITKLRKGGGTWFSIREVGKGNRARTLYYHGSATVLLGLTRRSVDDLHTSLSRMAATPANVASE